MAILGMGVDIVEVSRIARLLKKYGQRFLQKVFTEEERAYCLRRANPAVHLAARFAAKEAVSKALGTGFSRGVTWKSIGVSRNLGEHPTVVLTSGAKELAAAKGVQKVWLSLTHTEETAVAVAVLEGEGGET